MELKAEQFKKRKRKKKILNNSNKFLHTAFFINLIHQSTPSIQISLPDPPSSKNQSEGVDFTCRHERGRDNFFLYNSKVTGNLNPGYH